MNSGIQDFRNSGRLSPSPYSEYGVATISRLLKIIGLFCKIALQKRLSSAKKTYHFKEPTSRNRPIRREVDIWRSQFSHGISEIQ